MTAEGSLQVTDAVKTTHDPLHLSLGTCQQLYLALRIALLMRPTTWARRPHSGRRHPGELRHAPARVGAARALAELARMRQVILFTCHEEMVEAMRQPTPTLNEVDLAPGFVVQL